MNSNKQCLGDENYCVAVLKVDNGRKNVIMAAPTNDVRKMSSRLWGLVCVNNYQLYAADKFYH